MNSACSLTLALKLLKNHKKSFDWSGFDENSDIVLTPKLLVLLLQVLY